ncbi:MAG: PrgI family protein, partial [Patescibacteria group bacterium]
MRFQVPQFIEVEDKIFGPLTFKQFVYVAGGIGLCVILFIFLPKFLAILLALPVAALAGALAFYKVNDKPFINMVEAFFNYTLTNKLYIWKKEEKEAKSKGNEAADKPIQQVYVPKLSESKLR